MSQVVLLQIIVFTLVGNKVIYGQEVLTYDWPKTSIEAAEPSKTFLTLPMWNLLRILNEKKNKNGDTQEQPIRSENGDDVTATKMTSSNESPEVVPEIGYGSYAGGLFDNKKRNLVQDMTFRRPYATRNNMMHFGKRAAPSRRKRDVEPVDTTHEVKRSSNKMMHFGKRNDDGTPEDFSTLDAEKRNRMMHFGKRQDVSDDIVEELMNLDEAKRANNIMHFGKRNRMMHFGKRDYEDLFENEKRSSNRMMHFGKRFDDENDYQEELNEDKRANKLMHFGKRSPPVPEIYDEMDKRSSNRMMHFGKRASNKMMHFGKREFQTFDDLQKRANKLMHFGKREDNGIEFEDNDDIMAADKRSNRMMHFGKRYSETESNPAVVEQIRRVNPILFFGRRSGGNRMMHFGKRSTNRMMHFGKRNPSSYDLEDSSEIEKRANKMMHFGKRANNKLMHFGKRDDGNDLVDDEDFEMEKRAGNKLMHFGKRNDVSYKDMLEMGDWEDTSELEKRAKNNKLMHFGKRETTTSNLTATTSPASIISTNLNHQRRRRSINDDVMSSSEERMIRQLLLTPELWSSREVPEKRLGAVFRTPSPVQVPHALLARELFYDNRLQPRWLSRPSRSFRSLPAPKRRNMQKFLGNKLIHFG